MTFFPVVDGVLHAEQVPCTQIAAQAGTPCYVYSRAALTAAWQAFDDALGVHPHRVHFAVKANSNLAVLNVLARLGSGFDIVSGGELQRVLAAGGDPAHVVFSGVGKSEADIERALIAGIGCFNIESASELARLNRLAVAQGAVAPVAFRVNPDVDALTHPYISTGLKENKFGVAIDDAEALYAQAAQLPGIAVRGVACHIGSQLLTLQPFVDALQRVMALVDRLAEQGIDLQHVDVGGGLGVRYRDELPPAPADWAQAVLGVVGTRNLEVHCEPGRAIAANAGVLLTRVEALKATEVKNFAVVDAAMNDLLRPALYQAWMGVSRVVADSPAPVEIYDLVGPVCETGDWLARERALALAEGDLLAIHSAGAYGFTMASNYNSRGRAAEVMVDGATLHTVRARETFDDLIRGESCLP
jgi:diaminopimelate decarboxylase